MFLGNLSKQNKGSAFFVVILAMMILSIIGVAFLTLSVANAKTLANQNYSRQAYYLARSGADAVSRYIMDLPDTDAVLAGKAGTDNDDFPNGTYKVEVTGSASPSAGNLEVKGTATVKGITRSVTAVMRRKTWDEIIDKALYSTENLDITEMNVTGGVQSAGDIEWSEEGHHTFEDDAEPNSPEIITVNLPSTTSAAIEGDKILFLHETETLEYYTDTICYITNISLNQQSRLNVIAHDCEVNLIVNNLYVNNIFSIEVTDGGTVNIFITGEMDIDTSGYINNTDPKNLHIFLMDGTKFYMQANITLNGYIIGPGADVEIQSSNSIIRGAVFAKTITRNGVNGPNGEVIYISEKEPEEIPEYLKGYVVSLWKE